MVEWITVLSLILFGLALIVVEVVFIPGTTVVGVAGFVIVVVGLVLSFKYFDSETGWTTLGGVAVASGLLLFLSFKFNLWSRLTLKSSIDSKVNEVKVADFSIGQEGTTLSALRPGGKAELGTHVMEVRTLGEYVDAGIKVRIIKIFSNQIIVEPIN